MFGVGKGERFGWYIFILPFNFNQQISRIPAFPYVTIFPKEAASVFLTRQEYFFKRLVPENVPPLVSDFYRHACLFYRNSMQIFPPSPRVRNIAVVAKKKGVTTRWNILIRSRYVFFARSLALVFHLTSAPGGPRSYVYRRFVEVGR